jgi:hypothetical protein
LAQAVFYRDARDYEPVDAFLERLLSTQPLAAAKIDDAIEEHLKRTDGGSSAGVPDHIPA